jgi:hypothetical protein
MVTWRLSYPQQVGGTVVALGDVVFAERPMWQADAGWRRAREVEVALKADGASLPVRLRVPWSCDEGTHAKKPQG